MGWFRRRKPEDEGWDEPPLDPSTPPLVIDPSTDEAAVVALLEAAGATSAEAAEITALLGQRISPPEMVAWLEPNDDAHPVRDPDTIETFGVALAWTPTYAIRAGKTELVLRSAGLFAAGEADPLEPPPIDL